MGASLPEGGRAAAGRDPHLGDGWRRLVGARSAAYPARVSDDAVFHAVRAEPFAAGYVNRPEKGRAALDAVLAACLRDGLVESLDAGWDVASDLSDTSIDDRLEAEEERLALWGELRAGLLAAEACPWFARLCDARDVLGGVLSPDALAGLVERLRETGLLPALADALEADDVPNGYRELDAFLARSAAAGAWVLWHGR